jgi:hypothetical protein
MGDAFFCETCGAQLFPDSKFCTQCGMVVVKKEKERPKPVKDDPTKEKLYHIYSVVNNFKYREIVYDNLKIRWFVKDREIPQIPFERAVTGYVELTGTDKIHAENYVKECFTIDEVDQFKKHLVTVERIRARVETCYLPFSGTLKGHRDVSPVPGMDFISLYKRFSYDLPFKVEGVFNVRLAEERIVSDDGATLVSSINVKDIEKLLKKGKK